MTALLPEYTDFLSRLVQINSCYGKERAAQLLVKAKMEEIGLEPHVFHSRNDEESVNLAAKIIGSGQNRYKSLILNAHCDVAPVDGLQRWTRTPLSGEVSDGVLYGRGAQDDKAGIAITLLIAHVLKHTNTVLKGDLTIQSVVEDESTGNGSKVLVDNGFVADGVIIVDGTWSDRIIYAHLGQIWLDFIITGEPVAACVEDRGVNPVYIAMELIRQLNELINNLNVSADPFETVENPYFMNVGSLHSGVWHGSVPSHAKMEVQIGFPDDRAVEEILASVTAIAKSVHAGIEVQVGILKTPAFRGYKHNSLVKQLNSVIEVNTGRRAQEVAVSGHCDMRHFPTRNICLYGPGGGKNAHGIDEYYHLDQMPVVAANLLDFLHEWCNEPKHTLDGENH